MLVDPYTIRLTNADLWYINKERKNNVLKTSNHARRSQSVRVFSLLLGLKSGFELG